MNRTTWCKVLIMVTATFTWSSPVISKEADPAKQKILLTAVGKMLEQYHYSGRPIDDAFSKIIFEQYIDRLDHAKEILMDEDVKALQKYEVAIDDEIHGADIRFYPAVTSLMVKRLDEAMAIYKTILAKPFVFTKEEYLEKDKANYKYATTNAQRAERWRLQLKYLTLDNLIAAQNLQHQVTKTAASPKKTDLQLEKEAREKVLKLLNRRFVRIKADLNMDKQFDVFVNTITECMDPHTNYMPPAEKKQFDQEMSKKFYGIGARLLEEDGIIKIQGIEPGGPVWKNNEIGINDKIVKVGQGTTGPLEDITGLSTTDAIKLIRGDKGTTVRLGLIKADGTEKIVTLVRQEIVQDEALARSVVINNEGVKVGYISLPQFYADFNNPKGFHCAADVAREVIKLKAAQVSSIVIDLRNNGGGSLQEVIEMVGLFIPEGPVVQVKDKQGRIQVLKDVDKGVLYTGPLAVLVNEYSASASEIFAAAMQDYKRAVIIGSTSTFGKGTVQAPKPIYNFQSAGTDPSQEAAVKMTIQKFYRINGGSTQLKGVVPDLILADPYELLKFREQDRPLAMAWDSIPPAVYTAAANAAEISMFKDMGNKLIAVDSAFKIIRKNTLSLDESQNSKINLKMTDFKARRATMKTESDQLIKALELPDNKLLTIEQESAHDHLDELEKAKLERYKDWTKKLSKDIYIKKAVMIISKVPVT